MWRSDLRSVAVAEKYSFLGVELSITQNHILSPTPDGFEKVLGFQTSNFVGIKIAEKYSFLGGRWNLLPRIISWTRERIEVKCSQYEKNQLLLSLKENVQCV